MDDSKRSRAFLIKEFKRIQARINENYSVGLYEDNIYVWDVLIFGAINTPFENGIFTARMIFPLQYPESPPTFKFITKMYHPNIDNEGNVCISILHRPGDDEFGYEQLNERWMPVRNPESVIISILSLLNSPNCDSPANVDAARCLRDTPEMYHKIVRDLAQRSNE